MRLSFLFLLFSLLSLFPIFAETSLSNVSATPQSTDDTTFVVSSPRFSATLHDGIGQEVICWRGLTLGKGDVAEADWEMGALTLLFPGYPTAETFVTTRDTASQVITTNIVAHGLDFERQLFIYTKKNHSVLVHHLQTAEGSRSMNFRIALSNERVEAERVGSSGQKMLLYRYADSTAYRETLLYVKLSDDGAAIADDKGIRVIDATNVTLYLITGVRPIRTLSDHDKHDYTPSRLHRDLLSRLFTIVVKPYERLKPRQ